MALKICQLCAVDFTLKNFLLPLVDGMRAKGWQVVSVCSNGENVADLRTQGYCIQTISIARSINPFLALRSLIWLTLFFRRQSFDLVHVHTPVAALIGRIAAKLAGVPLLSIPHMDFIFTIICPTGSARYL